MPTRATPARSWTAPFWRATPTVVIEAMAIAGYAIGANQGYVYVRAEYPIAVQRLEIAIEQARELRSAGRRISSTPALILISRLRLGAGAFVCGEETALMTLHRGPPGRAPAASAVPGGQGPVRQADACSTTSRPTPISPRSSCRGADWFASMGTATSKGTKVFALGGKITQHRPGRDPHGHDAARDRRGDRRRHPQRQEVQGRADRRSLRRLHPRLAIIDTPIDYDNLIAIGSMMGSGGLIVMDEDTCMVDIAKFYPGIHRRRVLRQVHALPHRHPAAAAICWRRSPPAMASMEDLDKHRRAVPTTCKPPALCGSGPDRAEPGALHAAATSAMSTIAHIRG